MPIPPPINTTGRPCRLLIDGERARRRFHLDPVTNRELVVEVGGCEANLPDRDAVVVDSGNVRYRIRSHHRAFDASNRQSNGQKLAGTMGR